MMKLRLASLGLVLFAAAAGAGAFACYAAPEVEGLFRCEVDGLCPEGLLCDDGVCCNPDGDPVCPTYVKPDGTCSSGQSATFWYLDKDGDGFGGIAKQACGQPFEVPDTAPNATWVERGGDCDDESPDLNPGAPEQCNGRDDDCDGQFDEDFTAELEPYWQDVDGDGVGGGDPRQLCIAAGLFVATVGGDCNDDNPAVRPGVTEACNGVDDDCVGGVDDSVPSVACGDSGHPGICAAGKTVCTGATTVCVANVMPGTVAEVCNNDDDDCDGAIDERPLCGGVQSFIGNSNVVITAVNTNQDLGGVTSTCLWNVSGATAETVTQTGATLKWTSAGVGWRSHVISVKPKTGTWDLSRAGATLKFTADYTLTTDRSPPWDEHAQPVILLCGPNGIVRIKPDTAQTAANEELGPAKVGRIVVNAPLTGGGKYILAAPGTVNAARNVLKEVNRIEVMVQANYTANPASFVFTIDDFGLP